MKEIPTCTVARKRSGFADNANARRARVSPAAAWNSRRPRRTETMAISELAKKPLARMSTKMIANSIPKAVSIPISFSFSRLASSHSVSRARCGKSRKASAHGAASQPNPVALAARKWWRPAHLRWRCSWRCRRLACSIRPAVPYSNWQAWNANDQSHRSMKASSTVNSIGTGPYRALKQAILPQS